VYIQYVRSLMCVNAGAGNSNTYLGYMGYDTIIQLSMRVPKFKKIVNASNSIDKIDRNTIALQSTVSDQLLGYTS
jgi:hypothetical protein